MATFSLMHTFTWIFVFIFSLLAVSTILKGENTIRGTPSSSPLYTDTNTLTPLKISSEIKVQKKIREEFFKFTHSFFFFFFGFYQPSYFGLLFTKNYKICQCRGHMLKVNGILLLLAFSLLLAGFLRKICHLEELILNS